MTPPTATPQIGQPVLCDGRLHLITDRQKRYSRESDGFLFAVQFEDPQFRVFALEQDLRWSDELGAWYLWGRCLSPETQAAVIELRDRGRLVQRSTRTPGNPPAGGEHLDLYLALVHGKPKRFLEQELERIRRGEEMSPEFIQAAVLFDARWRGPHTDGYADPTDPPSTDIASRPTPGRA